MVQELVKSYPTKTLFIDILTQDIDVKDCILDLLDNSIDSYKRHDIVERRKIEILVQKKKFEIYDSCGGIEKDLLLEGAFIFGVDELKRDKKSIGLYGIGMKRSIFKIGKQIRLISNDGNFTNSLSIDIERWKKDKDNWDFHADSEVSKIDDELNFTKITISDIYTDIQEKFSSIPFLNILKSSIQKMFTLFIQNNVNIYLNGEKLQPLPIEIKTPENYNPARYRGNFNNVDIDIICYQEPGHKRESAKYKGRKGWNIFVNGRLILLDDTSKLTGWEAGKGRLPDFHPIYNNFRGLVFLDSEDPANLPITTTKTGLKTESVTYNHILKMMVNTARPVINYLSKKYTKEKQQTDNIIDDISQHTVDSSTTLLQDLPKENIKFTAPRSYQRTTTTVSYQKPIDIVEKVKKYLKVYSNKQVGSKTFDYFVDLKEIK